MRSTTLLFLSLFACGGQEDPTVTPPTTPTPPTDVVPPGFVTPPDNTTSTSCSGSRCVLAQTEWVGAFTVDHDHLYFAGKCTLQLDQLVFSVPKAGGKATAVPLHHDTIGPPGEYCAQDLLSDGTSLWWGDGDSISTASVAGGEIAPWSSWGASSLAFDSRYVYAIKMSSPSLIFGVPRAGGPAKVIADGDIAPDVVVGDGTTAYFSDSWGGGSIKAVTLATGEKTTLATLGGYPSFIAMDPTSLFVTGYSGNDFELWRIPRAGGPAVELAHGPGNGGPIVVDGDDVVFVNLLTGLVRVPKAGGAPVLVAADPHALYLAADDTAFYWSGSDGTLNKLTK